jgi:hypothetical protein
MAKSATDATHAQTLSHAARRKPDSVRATATMELPLTSSPSLSSPLSILRDRSHARALVVNHCAKWQIDAKVLRGAHRRLAVEVV